VRKAHPYLVYDRMDFEVPLGERGDTYDRYVVRIKEIQQSARIVAQALEQLRTSPFQGDVKPLKGREWKGVFRRRMGAYRIIFTLNHKSRTLLVLRILLRSEKTYR